MSPAVYRVVMAIGVLYLGAVISRLPGVMVGAPSFGTGLTANATAYILASPIVVAGWYAIWWRAVRWTAARLLLPATPSVINFVAITFVASGGWWGQGGPVWAMDWIWAATTALFVFFTAIVWKETGEERLKRMRDEDAAREVHCPKCGFAMRGLRSTTCPECGTTFTVDELVRASWDRAEKPAATSD